MQDECMYNCFGLGYTTYGGMQMRLWTLLRHEIWMARRAGGVRRALRGFWQRQILGPKTTRWHWSVLPPDALYEPRLLFASTPPVSVVGVDDNRVFICCTRAQRATIGDNPPIAGGSRVAFSTHLDQFWAAFFDEVHFCDRPVTVPRLLATTGLMRNYSYCGGETLNVKKTLEKIAREFGVGFLTLKFSQST